MPHENLPWALKHKEHKNGDAIYDNVLAQRVHTRRAGPRKIELNCVTCSSNDSASVAIICAALSISSQKHLGQVPQGDGADQGY